MGAYKFYNPVTSQYEITKSKSIIKPDGSLEYTPDDIKGIDNKINNLSTEVEEHKADLTSQEVGKGADTVGLPDPNNLFTSTNVGGAMQELFTNVSNGKQLIATAITDKDVPTSSSDTFGAMANKIGSIETGDYSIGDFVQAFEQKVEFQNVAMGFTIDTLAVKDGYRYDNYQASGSYYLRKIDMSTDTQVWQTLYYNGGNLTSIAISDTGDIFMTLTISSSDGKIIKISPLGVKIFEKPLPTSLGYVTYVSIKENSGYLVMYSGLPGSRCIIYGISEANGYTLWETNLYNNYNNTLQFTDYFVRKDGQIIAIYALDSSNVSIRIYTQNGVYAGQLKGASASNNPKKMVLLEDGYSFYLLDIINGAGQNLIKFTYDAGAGTYTEEKLSAIVPFTKTVNNPLYTNISYDESTQSLYICDSTALYKYNSNGTCEWMRFPSEIDLRWIPHYIFYLDSDVYIYAAFGTSIRTYKCIDYGVKIIL